jgi:hypothetical protein
VQAVSGSVPPGVFHMALAPFFYVTCCRSAQHADIGCSPSQKAGIDKSDNCIQVSVDEAMLRARHAALKGEGIEGGRKGRREDGDCGQEAATAGLNEDEIWRSCWLKLRRMRR